MKVNPVRVEADLPAQPQAWPREKGRVCKRRVTHAATA